MEIILKIGKKFEILENKDWTFLEDKLGIRKKIVNLEIERKNWKFGKGNQNLNKIFEFGKFLKFRKI